MPARSNDFQRLVLTFERQLHGAGFSVTESKMLADREGTLREIDIAIEGPFGPRRALFAVECRDRSRPADIQWIDCLAGKYQGLPVDRVIAVSRAGFTPRAARRAARETSPQIQTLSLTDAINSDWPAAFAHVKSLTLLEITPVSAPSFSSQSIRPSPYKTFLWKDCLRCTLVAWTSHGSQISLRSSGRAWTYETSPLGRLRQARPVS